VPSPYHSGTQPPCSQEPGFSDRPVIGDLEPRTGADLPDPLGLALLRPDPARAWIRLSGPDRLRFLQGQCTQDLAPMRPGDATTAFVLEPSGRLLAELQVLRFEEEIHLLPAAAGAAGLSAQLRRYGALSQVTLEEVPESSHSVVVGPEARSLLQSLGFPVPPVELDAAAAWIGAGPILVRKDPEAGPGAFCLHLPAGARDLWVGLERAVQEAGGQWLGPGEATTLRVRAAWPLHGVDYDGSCLPAETGLFARGVSLTKGCYVGQEAVAKQHYLGRLRRRFAVLDIEAKGGEAPIELLRDGVRVGAATSVAPAATGLRGLAILRGADWEVGSRLSARAGGLECPARVVDLHAAPLTPGLR
jgi:folate-binding protein YgfZ